MRRKPSSSAEAESTVKSAKPGVDDITFVSDSSRSGVPVAPPAETKYWTLPWLIGFGSIILFLWMAITLGWTGRTVAQAVGLLEDRNHTEALVEAVVVACKQQARFCQDESGATVMMDSQTIADCMRQQAKEVESTSSAPLTPLCGLAWKEAVTLANDDKMSPLPLGGLGRRLFGWATSSSAHAGVTSIALPMAGFLLSIVLLCVALGLGNTGRVFGIWISTQNRVSLARAQVTLWTVVILGAYAAFSFFNIGMMAEAIRDGLANGRDVSGLVTFPVIPGLVMGLLGISVGTTMLSALIKSGKHDAPNGTGSEQVGRWTDLMHQGPLEQRPSPAYASLADLFLGEQEDNRSNIDVSRLQNVIITLILVTGYAVLVFGFAREASAADVIVHFAGQTSLFPTLPEPSGSFVGLVSVSQGTYLLTKAVQ